MAPCPQKSGRPVLDFLGHRNRRGIAQYPAAETGTVPKPVKTPTLVVPVVGQRIAAVAVVAVVVVRVDAVAVVVVLEVG